MKVMQTRRPVEINFEIYTATVKGLNLNDANILYEIARLGIEKSADIASKHSTRELNMMFGKVEEKYWHGENDTIMVHFVIPHEIFDELDNWAETRNVDLFNLFALGVAKAKLGKR